MLRIQFSKAASVPADGNSHLEFSLVFPGGATPGKEITVSTSHGVLDPAGATDAAMRVLTVHTDGRDTLSLRLRAGREAGTGALTATIADSLRVQETFQLSRALPDLLALSPSPGSTFTATITRLDVTASLARRDPSGQVSAGTRVHLRTCCTLASAPGACDARLLVPAFVDATSAAPDSVKASVSLTAGGLAHVKQTGTPPTDDFIAVLHALVLRPNRAAPDCDALSMVTKPGAHADVAAGESVQLTLQRTASAAK